MPNTFGYIRVSSTDQNEDRQLDALRGKAVPTRNIYYLFLRTFSQNETKIS